MQHFILFVLCDMNLTLCLYLTALVQIRDAFIAEEGKTFIVADYGQLELRVLAHISNCTSMIDAFRQVTRYVIHCVYFAPKIHVVVGSFGRCETYLCQTIATFIGIVQGGCFHSRTAVGMYEYIKKAVDNGDVMLEWDYSKGQVSAEFNGYCSVYFKECSVDFS